jgi:hypothetical protein
MKQNKKLTNYVSDLDRFLNEYTHTHELTPVQRKERDKFRSLYAKRDNAARPAEPKKTIWDEF